MTMSIVIEPDCEIDASARIGTKPSAFMRKRLFSKLRVRRPIKGGVIVRRGAKIGAGV